MRPILLLLLCAPTLAAQSLSLEAGPEIGFHRYSRNTDSEQGWGFAGALTGARGPLAISVGYRSTTIEYGEFLEARSAEATSRSFTGELRYLFRPAYIAAHGSYGTWDGPDNGADPREENMAMVGGGAGVIMRATDRVGVHVGVRVARTLIATDAGGNVNGWFYAAHLGLSLGLVR